MFKNQMEIVHNHGAMAIVIRCFTRTFFLKVGSHDPIFSSNYSSVDFLRQQLDV